MYHGQNFREAKPVWNRNKYNAEFKQMPVRANSTAALQFASDSHRTMDINHMPKHSMDSQPSQLNKLLSSPNSPQAQKTYREVPSTKNPSTAASSFRRSSLQYQENNPSEQLYSPRQNMPISARSSGFKIQPPAENPYSYRIPKEEEESLRKKIQLLEQELDAQRKINTELSEEFEKFKERCMTHVSGLSSNNDMLIKLNTSIENLISAVTGLSQDLTQLASLNAKDSRALSLVNDLEDCAKKLGTLKNIELKEKNHVMGITLKEIAIEVADFQAQLKLAIPAIREELKPRYGDHNRFGLKEKKGLVECMEKLLPKTLQLTEKVEKIENLLKKREFSPHARQGEREGQPPKSARTLQSEFPATDRDEAIAEWKALAESLQKQNFDLRMRLEQANADTKYTTTQTDRGQFSFHSVRLFQKASDYLKESEAVHQQVLDGVVSLANQIVRNTKTLKSDSIYEIPQKFHQFCLNLFSDIENLVRTVQSGYQEDSNLKSELKEVIFQKIFYSGESQINTEQSSHLQTEKTKASSIVHEFHSRKPSFLIQQEKVSIDSKNGSGTMSRLNSLANTPSRKLESEGGFEISSRRASPIYMETNSPQNTSPGQERESQLEIKPRLKSKCQ